MKSFAMRSSLLWIKTRLIYTQLFIRATFALLKVSLRIFSNNRWFLFLGLALVYGKYLQGAYGYCPRALCDK